MSVGDGKQKWPSSTSSPRRGSRDSDFGIGRLNVTSYSHFETDHGFEVVQTLNEFRKMSLLTDKIICSDDKEFPCHSSILAATSTYFKAMFSSQLKEANEYRVKIKNISPGIMKLMLEYAYTGNLEITADNAQDVLTAASLLDYPRIIEACCEFLSNHLHPSNCLGIESFAQLHSCHALAKSAHQFALENFASVMDSEEFVELKLDRLLDYLNNDLIDVDKEEFVYEGAMKWLRYELTDRKKYITVVLQNVRLATVELGFLDNVAINPLISNNSECLSMIDDAKKYQTMTQDPQTRRRASLQRAQPRVSTIARQVMVLVGGHSNHDVFQSVDTYDPRKDKWMELPAMPLNVLWYSTSQLDNDIYVCGGVVENSIVDKVWRFNSKRREWSEVAPMLTPRARHSCVTVDNRLYVVGGIRLPGDINAVEDIESYCPLADKWRKVGESPCPRIMSKLVPWKDSFIELGGTQAGGRVRTIDSYIWEEAAATGPKLMRKESSNDDSDLPQEESKSLRLSGEQFILPEPIGFCQVLILNKIFFIIWEDSKTFISLDPKKRIFRKLRDLTFAHVNGAAAVLDDKIYVSGGMVDSKPSRILECYCPTTNTWTINKCLPQARACHGCVTIQI